MVGPRKQPPRCLPKPETHNQGTTEHKQLQRALGHTPTYPPPTHGTVLQKPDPSLLSKATMADACDAAAATTASSVPNRALDTHNTHSQPSTNPPDLRSVTGPLICYADGCTEEFPNALYLVTHANLNHRTGSLNPTRAPPHISICTLCNRSVQASLIDQHMRSCEIANYNVLMTSQPHSCSACGTPFTHDFPRKTDCEHAVCTTCFRD